MAQRWFALVLLALCGGWCPGQTAAKAPPRTSSVSGNAALAEQLRLVQEQLKEQRAQIVQQQDALVQLGQQLREAAADLREQGQRLEKSEQRNTEAEQSEKAESAAWDLRARNEEESLQATRKSVENLEHPTALRYKGVTLTPGGFLSTDFLVRSRNENADVTGNFGSTPFDGVVNAQLSEMRATSRGSRMTLLAEGVAGTTKLTGYYEMDFLAQAPTANQVQTNGFSPRQRQLWLQAAFNNGLTVTAGQTWSLITTGRKGMAVRAEFIPNTLEGSYVVGFDYVRQTAVRVTKNFNNRLWAGFEVANPETNQPNASYVPPNLFGFNNSSNSSSPSGSTLNFLAGSTNGFSTNLAPDLLAKIAWEPGWGHYELKLLGRFFRDRINGENNLSYGGGVGAAAILPVVRNKVDFIVEGLAGSGIGRYGAANGSDVTVRPDGKIIPIHAAHGLAGVELHPHAKFDIFVYSGDEYYGRAAYVNPTDSTKPAGYGSPLVDNRNCGIEVLPTGAAPCGAQNRNVGDGTAGFWYRFYKGPFGVLQYGAQYEFLFRGTWSGEGGAPQGQDHVMLTSLRYYLP